MSQLTGIFFFYPPGTGLGGADPEAARHVPQLQRVAPVQGGAVPGAEGGEDRAQGRDGHRRGELGVEPERPHPTPSRKNCVWLAKGPTNIGGTPEVHRGKIKNASQSCRIPTSTFCLIGGGEREGRTDTWMLLSRITLVGYKAVKPHPKLLIKKKSSCRLLNSEFSIPRAFFSGQDAPDEENVDLEEEGVAVRGTAEEPVGD